MIIKVAVITLWSHFLTQHWVVLELKYPLFFWESFHLSIFPDPQPHRLIAFFTKFSLHRPKQFLYFMLEILFWTQLLLSLHCLASCDPNFTTLQRYALFWFLCGIVRSFSLHIQILFRFPVKYSDYISWYCSVRVISFSKAGWRPTVGVVQRSHQLFKFPWDLSVLEKIVYSHSIRHCQHLHFFMVIRDSFSLSLMGFSDTLRPQMNVPCIFSIKYDVLLLLLLYLKY